VFVLPAALAALRPAADGELHKQVFHGTALHLHCLPATNTWRGSNKGSAFGCLRGMGWAPGTIPHLQPILPHHHTAKWLKRGCITNVMQQATAKNSCFHFYTPSLLVILLVFGPSPGPQTNNKYAKSATSKSVRILLRIPQVVICTNTEEELQELQARGLVDCIYCNQNAWLNYQTIFTIQHQRSDSGYHEATLAGQASPNSNMYVPTAATQPHFLPSFSPSEHHQYQHQLTAHLHDQDHPGYCKEQQQQQQVGVATVCHKHHQHHPQVGSEEGPQGVAEHHTLQQQQQATAATTTAKWDMMINANSCPFKRNHLAAAVANRIHISYMVRAQGKLAAHDSSSSQEEEEQLLQGKCLNMRQDGTYRWVAWQQMAYAGKLGDLHDEHPYF
jgi:hypothetical protein